MNIILIAIALVMLVLVAVVYLRNRPQLNTIDSPLPDDFPVDGFSHDVFEKLLKAYVDNTGKVDYESWHQSNEAISRLNSYLAAVSNFSPENTPERFGNRNDTLAYWLYAYNAFVIKSILDRWPLESVINVKAPFEIVRGFGFFYRQRYIFGKASYSLHAVENTKIRATYKDARIHFVLNCGSESCPSMPSVLPSGDDLEPLLQQAAIDFINDERNVKLDHDRKQVFLSEIFKWFEKDFVSDLRRRGLPTENGIADYLVSVAPEPQRSNLLRAVNYKIIYNDYDWSVNQTAA